MTLTKNLVLVTKMINLSEMYRISGGCRPDKNCEDCENFVVGKRNKCLLYPKHTMTNWNGKRMACRFFYENDEPNQLTIMGISKEKGNDGNC